MCSKSDDTEKKIRTKFIEYCKIHSENKNDDLFVVYLTVLYYIYKCQYLLFAMKPLNNIYSLHINTYKVVHTIEIHLKTPHCGLSVRVCEHGCVFFFIE